MDGRTLDASNPLPQHARRTSRRPPRRPTHCTHRGRLLGGRVVTRAKRCGTLALLLAVSVVLSSCEHRHWQNPHDVLQVLCAGSWDASPLSGGPPGPPAGYESLVIAINEQVDPATAMATPPHVYGRGTVTWNGVSWPMTLELGPQGPYCRYAEGRPFHGTHDPDGFNFQVLAPRANPIAPGQYDRLFVDHDAVAGRSSEYSLECEWHCHSRGGN